MKKLPTVDELLAEAEKARGEWLAENSANGVLERRITAALDKRLDDTIGKLMGFNTSWGKWEVDNCNGRAGNSAAGDFLRERAADAVKEWLTKQAGKLPKLHKNAVKSLHENYLETYRRSLQTELYNLAQSNAKKDAAGIMLKVTGVSQETD